MVLIKVNELKEIQLDWAVSACEGWMGDVIDLPNYSSDWARGGPIIERRNIDIQHQKNNTCVAALWAVATTKDPVLNMTNIHEKHKRFHSGGNTPLIAAMRCYVSSKLGDTVEIPEELL